MTLKRLVISRPSVPASRFQQTSAGATGREQQEHDGNAGCIESNFWLMLVGWQIDRLKDLLLFTATVATDGLRCSVRWSVRDRCVMLR